MKEFLGPLDLMCAMAEQEIELAAIETAKKKEYRWQPVPTPLGTICLLWNGQAVSNLVVFDTDREREEAERIFAATDYLPIPVPPGHPAYERERIRSKNN
jgi:hypothetical protein